jgi:hypothetical protein
MEAGGAQRGLTPRCRRLQFPQPQNDTAGRDRRSPTSISAPRRTHSRPKEGRAGKACGPSGCRDRRKCDRSGVRTNGAAGSAAPPALDHLLLVLGNGLRVGATRLQVVAQRGHDQRLDFGGGHALDRSSRLGRLRLVPQHRLGDAIAVARAAFCWCGSGSCRRRMLLKRNEARSGGPINTRIHLFVWRGLPQGWLLHVSDHTDFEHGMLPGRSSMCWHESAPDRISFSFSTALPTIVAATLPFLTTSRCCTFHPIHRSSIPRKISGMRSARKSLKTMRSSRRRARQTQGGHPLHRAQSQARPIHRLLPLHRQLTLM